MSRQGTPLPEGAALDAEASADPASPTDQGEESAEQPTPANKQPSRADDPALLQRAFTQSQQRWAELRKSLGLPKDATPDDVMAAINAARAATAADDDDEGSEPLPEAVVLEVEARAEAAEWRLQEAYYPETAQAAREFAEFARTERDPEALTMKFYELLNRFSEGGEAAAEEAGEAPPAEDGRVDAVEMEFGESPAADEGSSAALDQLRGSGRIAEGLRKLPGWDRFVGGMPTG